MEPITINRTAGKALKFSGEKLAEVGGQWHNGVGRNRFSTYTLYRTADGRYVLQDDYTSHWQGEDCSMKASVYQTAEALYDGLLGLDAELSEEFTRLLKEAAEQDGAIEALMVEEL